MTKRSHDIASRQAAISRERKKKKRSQPSEKQLESPGTPSQVGVVADSSSAKASVVQKPTQSASTRSAQTIQSDENRYQYVIKDLRKTAIIAVPLIVILIILAFVL
ncbi:MAG: hypothetical protein WC455_01705 [Dehalococcoidia bacterium]|jgi:hypothetical protein